MNFLASPPLVVAYAIAGTVDIDLTRDPIGARRGRQGRLPARHLADGPRNPGVHRAAACPPRCSRSPTRTCSRATSAGAASAVPESETYAWDGASTYIQNPPYFDGMNRKPPGLPSVRGARCLALFGDSITTDHISPAGAIRKDAPAGRYLQDQGVVPADFNSYGSRRGNHEIMMRGTFANTRIKNLMVPGVEGGVTAHQPGGEKMPIYDAAMKYVAAGVPLVVIAGKEYGTGSSRDWAAKGTSLLGVKAVIAESFERIHRANLVGMGVFPLTFQSGQTAASLGLDGTEIYDFEGLHNGSREARVTATSPSGKLTRFAAQCPRRHAEGVGIHGERRDPALRAAPARGLSRAAMRVAVFDLDGTITRARHAVALPARLGAPAAAPRFLAARHRRRRPLPARPRSRPAQVRVDPRRDGRRLASRSG